MAAKRLMQFLDESGVPFETIPHTTAYTAQGLAAAMHVRGREVAKCTVVKVDDHFGLAVLPAPRRVDLDSLRRLTRSRSVALATEPEFAGLFPGCEVGAMPPFGNLYGLPVWVDESLQEDPTIVFNAGNHREVVRMSFADFARLAHPAIGAFAAH
jgi:Ala-tRNA(Pro) deacylase